VLGIGVSEAVDCILAVCTLSMTVWPEAAHESAIFLEKCPKVVWVGARKLFKAALSFEKVSGF